MSNSDIAVSVIICTYNNGSMLDRVLDCLAGQRAPEEIAWEVLVVANNCSDNTARVVEAHRAAARIPRLRILDEPTQGLTPARQRGVRETSGEWVVFVDDDCLLDASWLAHALLFTGSNERCGALGGRVLPRWEPGADPLPAEVGWTLACQDYGPVPVEVASLVGAGLMLRRRAIDETG